MKRRTEGDFSMGLNWKSVQGFQQAVGTKPHWTLEHVQQLTPRFFQIGAKNSETHYVQIFPPSTMSISMSNKHVPNILWWCGWCLALLVDSLKGHEVQLAYVKPSLIVWLTMSSQFMPFHYPRPKMVTNTIKNRHPIQPMRWGKMHSRGQIFFLRVGVGVWGNLIFPLFSIQFYHVPNMFPIAPYVIPYSLPKLLLL